MAEQKMRSQTQELMSWMEFRNKLNADIEDVKEEIKLKTDGERASLKAYRKDLKVANFEIEALHKSIKEEVEANQSVSATITLDDFDVSDSNIDVELARGQMDKANKEEEE